MRGPRALCRDSANLGVVKGVSYEVSCGVVWCGVVWCGSPYEVHCAARGS
jgi:hypothetical protein